jgi:hypothetical protein
MPRVPQYQTVARRSIAPFQSTPSHAAQRGALLDRQLAEQRSGNERKKKGLGLDCDWPVPLCSRSCPVRNGYFICRSIYRDIWWSVHGYLGRSYVAKA